MAAISKSVSRATLGTLGCLWLLATNLFAGGESSREQLDFFEQRIRPVLVEHCYQCHSDQAKELKGGLHLEFGDTLLQGGDSGPAIVPGKPDESLLIAAVRYESLEMPPQGKLPEGVIADLVKWVRMGAPDPRIEGSKPADSPPIDHRQDHWAFQPITDPSRPSVSARYWPIADSDYFILNRLEQQGLRPAEDANRYVWLRRVSLDLTGLPPTVEELRSFAADESATAYADVVDRLLASPAFGERWARHWLDLVGYADQVGTSNDVFAEQAWRYRDYVINSLNDDLPFDRFIREQLAGDLIPYENVAERAAAITATGFLVLGDLEIVEADKAKLRVDIVDQQVVKTSKAFLSLTVGCARCHDHKFDPISQRDYYAMAGFFHGTQSVYKTDRGVWSDILQLELPEPKSDAEARVERARRHAEKIARWKDDRSAATKQKDELDALLRQDDAAAEVAREARTRERDELANRIGQLNRQIVHAEFFSPGVPRAHGVRDLEQPTNMRITIRGNPHALGDEVPRGFIKVASRSVNSVPTLSALESGRRALADWIASPANPLTARVAVNRIWQQLFGTGLVASVDYFGVRGELPSHPELLDHLATKFMREGWSRKSLIRSLVLSRAYRISSAHNAQASEIDPANRLLWRMNRRRLDAESLRDSMLAISGQLHMSAGGPALPLEFPENVGNVDPKNVNPPSFSLSKWRPEQFVERTIYLPIIRSAAQPGPAELRNIFDFPQPAGFAGQRDTTAVPTQALFLMNSPAVKQHATQLAKCVQDLCPDEAMRLELLWLRTLNRPLAPEEKVEASEFLARGGEGAWVELCHALLATNEFLMTL